MQNMCVLITGAATGIGRGAALEVARRGATVVVTDINTELGEQTMRDIRDAGGQAEFMTLDISDLAGAREVVAQVIGDHGAIHSLINAAGMPMPIAAHEITEEQFDRVISVNLRGTFFLSKYAIEHMMRSEHENTIVNVASVMGLVAGLPNQPAYCASKGGIVMMTKAMALDYARNAIRINAVCPCLTDTPGIDDFLRRQLPDAEAVAVARAELQEVQPIGRMNTIEEVGRSIAFLAGPDSSGITGIALPVDGGFVAR